MNIDSIRAEVFLRRPKFAELVRTWGNNTLLEYYTQAFNPTQSPSEDVLNAISSEVANVLGKQLAELTKAALAKQKWVNTADHHGLLHHPYFYTTSLALSDMRVRKDNLVTIAFPFGGVSLGNDSFPRGFSFHDQDLNLQKIFFKSLSYRRLPIYALKPMTKIELTREKHRSASMALTKTASIELQAFFDSLLTDERVWSQDTYSSQLTVINNIMWRQLFGEDRGDLVYLEIESVVRRLLLEKYLPDESLICDLIFKSHWREKFLELFNGIQGSHDANSGTHFFWYIDYDSLTRRRLIVSGDNLITPDKKVTIPLTKEAVIDGLIKRTLMPSSALTLIIIQEIENLTCGGGPSQLQYLSLFEENWAKLLNHFGQSRSYKNASIWCGDNNLFCITNTKKGKPEQATFIDVLLYTQNRSSLIDMALEQTKIDSLVQAMIPALFYIYTHQKTSLTNCTTQKLVIR